MHQGHLANVGALIASLGDAADHDIGHLGGVDAGALGQGLQLARKQLDRLEALEAAFVAASPTRAAQGFNDEGALHACICLRLAHCHGATTKLTTVAQEPPMLRVCMRWAPSI